MILRLKCCRSGKVGDRALHAVDIPSELEGEWRVEEDFLAAVKSKGRVLPHPNFEDGLRYMRVVQGVSDSRARNEWVADQNLTSLSDSTASVESPTRYRLTKSAQTSSVIS